MSQIDRKKETTAILYDFIRRKGIVYTCGLLIGIVSRLTLDDLQLYQEIKHRHQKLK